MTTSTQELLVNGYIRLESKPYYVPTEISKLCLLWFVPIKTTKCNLKNHVFKIFEYLQPTKILCKGAYSTTLEVKHKESGKKYALKKYYHLFHNSKISKQILKEIKLLIHFKHPNIMRLIDVIPPESHNKNTFDDIFIVMPRMVNFCKLIRSKQILTQRHIQYMIYQILRGLDYVHKCGAVHGAIRPEHILINAADCHVRITGLMDAVCINTQPDCSANDWNEYQYYQSQTAYEAPEFMLIGSDLIIDEKIDQWGVGLVAAELYVRKAAFFGNHLRSVRLAKMFDLLGIPKDVSWIKTAAAKLLIARLTEREPQGLTLNAILTGCSELGCEFIGSLLALNPNQRISGTKAMSHEWLKEFHNHRWGKKKFEISLFDFSSLEKVKENAEIRQLMYDELDSFYLVAPQK